MKQSTKNRIKKELIKGMLDLEIFPYEYKFRFLVNNDSTYLIQSNRKLNQKLLSNILSVHGYSYIGWGKITGFNNYNPVFRYDYIFEKGVLWKTIS